MRFIGSSVLMVYEGDANCLASAIERYDRRNWSRNESRSYPSDDGDEIVARGDGSNSDDDSISSSDENEDDDDVDDNDDDNDDDDDNKESQNPRRARGPPVSIRMIDFAHTRLVDGEGPDEGVLKGLRTLRGLVKGRKEEVLGFVLGAEQAFAQHGSYAD